MTALVSPTVGSPSGGTRPPAQQGASALLAAGDQAVVERRSERFEAALSEADVTGRQRPDTAPERPDADAEGAQGADSAAAPDQLGGPAMSMSTQGSVGQPATQQPAAMLPAGVVAEPPPPSVPPSAEAARALPVKAGQSTTVVPLPGVRDATAPSTVDAAAAPPRTAPVMTTPLAPPTAVAAATPLVPPTALTTPTAVSTATPPATPTPSAAPPIDLPSDAVVPPVTTGSTSPAAASIQPDAADGQATPTVGLPLTSAAVLTPLPQAQPAIVASSSAATSSPAAPTASAAWTSSVVTAQLGARALAAAVQATSSGVRSITVQLRPAQLGSVQIVATMDSGGLSLRLHAASDVTRQALRAGLGDLRADLALGGINDVGRLEVSDRVPDQPSGGQQPAGQQPAGHQFAGNQTSQQPSNQTTGQRQEPGRRSGAPSPPAEPASWRTEQAAVARTPGPGRLDLTV